MKSKKKKRKFTFLSSPVGKYIKSNAEFSFFLKRWTKHANLTRLYYAYQTIINEYTEKQNKYQSLFSSPAVVLEKKYNTFQNDLYYARSLFETADFLKRIKKKKASNWFTQINLPKLDQNFSKKLLLIIIIKNSCSFFYIL